ncbi:hypothetical protein B0H14DRAFT_3627948 [Mycena olivaceomarginata]|nr:hypothetical protein B0H14DRAFT_3627948 [Mycena olivaceomarginata]
MPKAQRSAISERNPLDFVQQPRKRKSKGSTKTLSDAAKASRAAAAETRKQSNAALEEEFSQIFTKREEQIAHLSEKYKKSAKYIRQVLENGCPLHGEARAQSQERDQAPPLEKGQRNNVLDIDLKGEEYEDYKDSLSKEERADLIAQLVEYKGLKEHGIRATNKAVALDAVQNTSQIGERQSSRAFSMFSRGHPDDPALPCFVDSDNARQFFQDVLDTSVYDLVRKYELWCINQDKPVRQGREKAELCKFISSSVEEALRKATGIKTLKMVWVNYMIDIVHKYGVELAGWPAKVAMVRPSQLRGQDVRLVVERLRNGTMRWVGLTKTQRNEVAAEVEKLRESGAAKPRRERSDKNQPRGPRTKKAAAADADADDSDDESSEDDGSGDESDKSGAGSPPTVSPFIAVPPVGAPFGTASSPVPTPSRIPTPSSIPAPSRIPALSGIPAPSPIPAPSQIPAPSSIPVPSPTPAPSPFPAAISLPAPVPSAGGGWPAPLPIPTATPFPTTAAPVPFGGALASDIHDQNLTPASIPGATSLLPSYNDPFALDFDSMDLTMAAFVARPDNSTDDLSRPSWRLNTSNRDGSGVDGGISSAALRASGGTGPSPGTPYTQGHTPYMQGYLQGAPYVQGNAHGVQGNIYADTPLHTQSGVPGGASHNSYAAAAGPFMSVFSVSTNTTTARKRTRAEGEVGGGRGEEGDEAGAQKGGWGGRGGQQAGRPRLWHFSVHSLGP